MISNIFKKNPDHKYVIRFTSLTSSLCLKLVSLSCRVKVEFEK